MNCANCNNPAGPDSLRITKGGSMMEYMIEICESCQKDVRTLKIVLERKAKGGDFEFEGLLPVAMWKDDMDPLHALEKETQETERRVPRK